MMELNALTDMMLIESNSTDRPAAVSLGSARSDRAAGSLFTQFLHWVSTLKRKMMSAVIIIIFIL